MNADNVTEAHALADAANRCHRGKRAPWPSVGSHVVVDGKLVHEDGCLGCRAEAERAGLLSVVATLQQRALTAEEQLRETLGRADDAEAAAAMLQESLEASTRALEEEEDARDAAEARVATLQQERDHFSNVAALVGAGAGAELVAVRERETRLREALESIVLRCEEGSAKTDWLPTIARIARAALVVSSQPGEEKP